MVSRLLSRDSVGIFAILLTASAIWLPLQLPLAHADSTSNILVNGDFSNGLLGWTNHKVTTLFGVRGEYPIFEVLRQNPGYSGGQGTPDTCFPSQRTGNPFLSIEVPFGTEGYVEQPVFIPTSGAATLSLLSWGWEGSNQTLGFSGLVNASVRIVASNIEHTLDTFTPPSMFTPAGSASSGTAVCTGKSPVFKSYDLSGYSGQLVKLRLDATSGNCCGTNAFFDDIDLEAQGIALHCPPNAGFQARLDSCAVPNAVVGVSYSYYFPVTGGVPPYFFDSRYFCGSSCPPGLYLNEVGQIWGTPTQAGVFPLLLKITDGDGQGQNSASIPITLTVTPIITNVSPYSGVSPSAGPAKGGTAVNITGVGFKEDDTCFVSGACSSTKSLRFGSNDVSSGSFHVMNDTWVKVDSTPENKVCSYLFFCSDNRPGLANVTLVVSVCYAASGSCNDYSSWFECLTPSVIEVSVASPRCNQFNYTEERQEPFCANGPGFSDLGTELNFETPSDGKVGFSLSGSISANATTRMCIQIDNWNLKLFNFTATVDLSAGVSASVSVTAEDSNLSHPYPLHTPFQHCCLSIGPVIIVPTITPVLMYQAFVEGKFEVGISHHSSTTFGINYTQTQGQPKFIPPTMRCWDPRTDLNSTFCIQPMLVASVGASVRIMIGLQFSLLIYDIAGPVITPDLYLHLDAGHSFTTSSENNPDYSCEDVLEGYQAGSFAAICAGVEVRLGFQLNPWLSILQMLDPGTPTNWDAIHPIQVASVLLAGSVSISPPSGSVSMDPGQSEQFSATVAGSDPALVRNKDNWKPTWTTTPDNCGTISPISALTITYTAPISSGPTTCILQARRSIFRIGNTNLLDYLPCSKDYFLDNLPCFSPQVQVQVSVRSSQFDFTLSNSGSVSVQQGGVGKNTITATLTKDTSQWITLSCITPLPSGVGCLFSPSSVTPTGSSVLSLSTTSATPTGSFQITVSGNPLGTTTAPTTFSLTVNPLGSPMFQHDLEHTGRSPYVGSPLPTLVWKSSTGIPTGGPGFGSPNSKSPAIGPDGTIYFASADGHLYAFGPDGTQKWRFTFPTEGLDSTPAIGADGTIYLGGYNVFAAITPNGSLKWQYPLNDYTFVGSSPAIDPDGTTIYFASSSGLLYALDTANGSLKWKYLRGGGNWESSPAIGPDGTIYIGGYGSLHAVYPNGTRKWLYPFSSQSIVYSSPAIGPDGTIYVSDAGSNLYAISPAGTLDWNYTTGGSWSSPALGSDGTIYSESLDGHVYALNPDGSFKWIFNACRVVAYCIYWRSSSSPAIGGDGTLYVGSLDHNLYAITPTGTLRWNYTTGDIVESSPAIGADGTIHVGSNDGNLYAINDVKPPTPPQNPSATGQSGQILVQWQIPSSNGGSTIWGYKLYRGTSSGDLPLYHGWITATFFVDTSVDCQVTYYYKVSAFNTMGEGPVSAEVSTASFCPPSSPLNLHATGGAYMVNLTLQGPASDGGSPITEYKIYRGTSPGGEIPVNSVHPIPNYIDYSVTCQTTYYYKASALNAAGEGPLSNEASATAYCEPSYPQNLVANGQTNQITLSWQTPASDGGSPITGYEIYRGTSPNSEGFLTKSGVVTSYADTSVTRGIAYYYEIAALNYAGEGSFSNEASAATAKRATTTDVSCSLASVPVNAPTTCTATVTDTSSGMFITPTGTVSFTSSVATSTFSPAEICTLTGSAASATCSVTYTQTGSNTTPTITASYAGDTNHSSASGSFNLTVQSPSFNWILLGVVIGILAAAGIIATYTYRRKARNIRDRSLKQ